MPDPRDLGALFTHYGTDKHKAGYTPVYHALFKHLRDQPLSILEIGIGTLTPGVPSTMDGVGLPGYQPGGSLRAWRDYFPQAMIYGIDVQPDAQIYFDDRIITYLCDSTDADAVDSLFPVARFHLIIDDGSHDPAVQFTTFKNFWLRVRHGGFYVIEDVLYDGPLFTEIGAAVQDRVGDHAMFVVKTTTATPAHCLVVITYP